MVKYFAVFILLYFQRNLHTLSASMAQEGLHVYALCVCLCLCVWKRNVKRLPAPYGDCKDSTTFDAADNAYSELYPVQYTASVSTKHLRYRLNFSPWNMKFR